ncbi:transporter [Hymenobacter aerilatus]|uniref:Transporter n=1 Tax=Hymenobacter aerilatus TaxID=2932251 RepID=A0A8T9SWZ8_9BACT|nr:transporter [Hymenobacter aerilatus]UOR05263.1 transporter [Hymenobacter aerilatus]
MPHFYYWLLAPLLVVGLSARAQTNDTIPVDKSRYDLLHPTPRKYMRPMVPDRPGITESPYTVDAGHFQLESDGLRLINSRDGDARDRSLYLNHVLMKIGLTNQTDFQIGLNSYTISKHWEDKATAEPERQARMGDMVVRLKRNIIGDDNKPFALAAIGYVRLPTGKQVGDGAVEYGVLVPAIYKLPNDWNVGAQTAAEWMYNRESAVHYLQLTPTFTIDKEFTEWLEGFVEVVGRWDTRQNSWQASLNLGPQFDISKNLQFDIGTHLALNRQTDHEYFVGFSFRL